jgi:FAD-dependent urate hydroxylase
MVNAPTVSVVIVGAGPYGLSVGAHLRIRGLEFRLFGTPMATWLQHMPARMFLKSAGFASNLSEPTGGHTLHRFCVDHGLRYEDDVGPVPLSTFAEYGLWFQRRLLPDVEQDNVVALSKHDGAFRLELASGESLATRSVVLAVGSTYFAYTPPMFDALPPELVSHTSCHRDFSGFSGRDVTVIGAGQSALESAALLHEAGANVRVVARRQVVVWNTEPTKGRRAVPMRVVRPAAGLGPGWKNLFYSNGASLFHHLPHGSRTAIVGRALGPAGAWWLKDRLIGKVPLLTGQLIRAAEPHGSGILLRVEQPDGHVGHIVTDHVVAGTGYRVDLAALGFLREPLVSALCRSGRVPVLTRNFESIVPNLYLTGLAAANSFGPSMRFVFGADFAARRLVKRLATDPGPYRNGARRDVARLTDDRP